MISITTVQKETISTPAAPEKPEIREFLLFVGCLLAVCSATSLFGEECMLASLHPN
jgi:hypothetical protein